MSRRNILTQLDCVRALYAGYILENEHGYSVLLKKGIQQKTNPSRQGRNKDYKFDYKTWCTIGRISLWERLKNAYYNLEVV